LCVDKQPTKGRGGKGGGEFAGLVVRRDVVDLEGGPHALRVARGCDLNAREHKAV